MDCSIIIVNFNNSGQLQDCLLSIPSAAGHLSCETLVIDNSMGDPGLPPLQQKFRDAAQFIANGENAGFAKACNQGAQLARGEMLLFLNPDTVLKPGSIRVLADHLKNHPETGIAAPKVLNPDGTLQYSCRRFPTLWTGLFNRYSLLSRLFPNNPYTRDYLMMDYDHQQTREVDWVSGCCMMLPRRIFESAGGFDENFFLFNEDVDLCKSVRGRGYRVMYLPETEILHHISSSNRRIAVATIIRRHMGMSWYYRKYKNENSVPLLIVDTLVFLRCLSQILLNPFK